MKPFGYKTECYMRDPNGNKSTQEIGIAFILDKDIGLMHILINKYEYVVDIKKILPMFLTDLSNIVENLGYMPKENDKHK